MKKLAFFAFLLTSCATVQQPTTAVKQTCRNADIYLSRGVNIIHLKGAEIIGEQDEFCTFVHNGIVRMEKAPFRIVCNQ
jgi:hypothetical protein